MVVVIKPVIILANVNPDAILLNTDMILLLKKGFLAILPLTSGLLVPLILSSAFRISLSTPLGILLLSLPFQSCPNKDLTLFNVGFSIELLSLSVVKKSVIKTIYTLKEKEEIRDIAAQ